MTVRAWLVAVLVAVCGWPAAAAADPVPSIVLDRDGPVTLLVQSKSAINVLGLSVTSPLIAPVCTDCRGGESLALGAMSRGTEVVLRLSDGEKTFLSTDAAHARIDQTGGTWRIGWDDAYGDGDLVVTVAVPTLPPPVDRDGDGVSPPEDCDDTNSAVRPGAVEVPGNGLDDDCVGGDAPARIAAVVTLRWVQARAGAPRRRGRGSRSSAAAASGASSSARRGCAATARASCSASCRDASAQGGRSTSSSPRPAWSARCGATRCARAASPTAGRCACRRGPAAP
jgi:hypothetical protein